MKNGIPQPLSEGEEAFALHCRVHGLSPDREVKFDPDRNWRFDFTFPGMLAVEVDGGTKFGKSRHSRGSGYEEDCRKLNRAAILGWRVLRFSTAMVLSGEAINTVESALKMNQDDHS